VLVLGDVGRSPRMQYHALALADAKAHVDLIGHAGSELLPAVRRHADISCHFLPDSAPPGRHQLPRWVFLSSALLRVCRQSLSLLRFLFWIAPKPHYFLVQTPPAIPTLLITWLAARLRAARLVVDWHNFGHSMLALTVSPRRLSVRLAEWHEQWIGRKADAHLCVSHRMRDTLIQQWGLEKVTVLHDHPARQFAPTPPAVRRDLFCRLQNEGVLPANVYNADAPNRPALIVSATSWTADEDFTLLLDAVSLWDARLQKTFFSRSVPGALFLLTGKGPLRESYEKRIRGMNLRLIGIHTLWVSSEDYPLLLGSADLGLCMHRSASGCDLPMKVADMFGSGLPVCALDYGPCLAEQIRHGENGLLFSTPVQLVEQLEELFKDFPTHTPLLNRLRQRVLEGNLYRWADAWNDHARSIFSIP
jgi:beta-1,4-mannosyltransferase